MPQVKNAENLANEWKQEESLKLYYNAEHHIRDVIQRYEESALYWGLYISYIKESLKKEKVHEIATHLDLLSETVPKFGYDIRTARNSIFEYSKHNEE